MFAINHAATALVIKKYYPKVSLGWLLLSVQFVEILWVLFNYLGIERTSTEVAVDTVRDVHLEYMPYSHSIASSAILALVAWYVIGVVYKRRNVAAAVAIGIFSHIVLDVLTHTRDISIVPFLFDYETGLGLYAMPWVAFIVETVYGVLCWWVYRGSRMLLATILAFNLANISFFSVALKGPEVLLANHPLWIVSVVALQIFVTLLLVGLFAKPRAEALARQAA